MRNKLSLKKKEGFIASLDLKEDLYDSLVKELKKYERKLTITEIIKKFWDNPKYTDNEIVFLIFELGISKSRQQVYDYSVGSIDILNELLNKKLKGGKKK